jgi:hypothetical protein
LPANKEKDLGILNLENFESPLRLRWLWVDWVDNTNVWILLGNLCNNHDHKLFAAATTAIVANGEKTRFWTSPWFAGLWPKHSAPKLFGL